MILPVMAQGKHGSQRREATRVRSMSSVRKLRRVSAVRTAHQDLEIWKSDLATEFRVAGAVHAFYHRRRFLTGLVWDMLAAAALLGE
ncbi:MAG: hypothetical protein ACKOJB_03600, partial [Chthoniobacterales bacterium]